jgi:GNAT superfamily N-acetyltransferase
VAEVVRLLRKFSDEAGVQSENSRLEWVVQTITRDPSRGIIVLAENSEGTASSRVAIACVATSLDPLLGWIGRLSCLFVVPPLRRRGIAGWLLSETLEISRYRGINRIRCETGPGERAARQLLRRASFFERSEGIHQIDLPAHFDDDEP